MTAEEFVAKWKNSAAAELANSQSFLIELCDLLDVPRPEPTRAEEDLNLYTFEKAVTFHYADGTRSPGRIDLYRRGCFVLESKQGSERRAAEQEFLSTALRQRRIRTGTAERGTPGWEQAMVKARKQAEGYAKALPDWPPFLIVADIGHCFDLYADFTGTGKLYQPFPDPKNYRIRLADLEKADVRETLRAIWLDPPSLDESKRSAKVTRELAARLARLAKSLEEQRDKTGTRHYSPEDVANFLMRCLFTMFAEDVELIPKDSFTRLLESLRDTPAGFAPTIEALWREMDKGCDFSPILRTQLKQFNGGLFESQQALPLNHDQLELLIEASKAQWRDVEPAIFGTLLERALDPHERHKLGAHYTPRAYVERLVMPTIIEPLREQWDETYAAATQLLSDGDSAAAVRLIREFHAKLCETRVLDPACGSGNFLYVSLELMKRLEGEVLNALREFGEKQLPLLTIDPHQFLGIEVNPRAAAITDLVLWIGYLQWHFRTRGNAPLNEPIIRKFQNIECRDAVLAWDTVEPVTDEAGNPVTRWDGRTTKPHPVTGEEVPDETAQIQELRYINPRKAEWPMADYVVGNPPFIGSKRMRAALGTGYVDAIHVVHPLPTQSADYVLYWWHRAARLVADGAVERLGLVTTNGITSTLNRQCIEDVLQDGEVSFLYAVPDHPWVDEAGRADVRVAMSVVSSGSLDGELELVLDPKQQADEDGIVPTRRLYGAISARMHIGPQLATLQRLTANGGVSFMGVIPVGAGFRLTTADCKTLGLDVQRLPAPVRHYRIGKDITGREKVRYIIDFFGLTEAEVRTHYPRLFQHVLLNVKPLRDENKDRGFREKWWIFGRPRPEMRNALCSLSRYIATSETAKHRTFQFLDPEVLPDQKIRVIADERGWMLGIVSSSPHVHFAIAQGNRVGVGNDPVYNNTECFEKFPFPAFQHRSAERIATVAEQLDAHRKRQQALHPDLTMTGMYNVLEKLRSGESLTTKEQDIHEKGLVSVLKQIHDELDAAVFDAYGWPHDLTDEQILERLVALNHERAEEESRGLIRWLRPEFQNPAGTTQTQITTEDEEPETPTPIPTGAKPKKAPWPKSLPERIRALRHALADHAAPAAPETLAQRFTRARKADVEELLETLVEVGQARLTEDGRYVA